MRMRPLCFSVEDAIEGQGEGLSWEMNLHHRLFPTDPRKAALLPGETLPVCHFLAGPAE